MPVDTSRLGPNDVAVFGVPWDVHSSFLRGPALAPPQIRAALHSGSANLCAENGLDLGADRRWHDLGDLTVPLGDNDAAMTTITAAAQAVLDRGGRCLTLGGDHATTLPLLRAYGKAYPDLTVLQIDAHSDLYDELDGDRYSHACPFARALEAGLIRRLVQIGVRTLTPHLRAQADRFGVECIEMRNWRADTALNLNSPLYVTLDLDALDPACAPGVSHHEPGGFTARDVLRIIQTLPVAPVGADIVEFNPVRDHVGMTAMLAAKLLKELLARMLA